MTDRIDTWAAGLGLPTERARVFTGLAAAMGSGLGTVCALVAGADPAAIAVGLAGFSPALAAIALAAVFLPAGGRAWVIAAAAAVVTWFVSQALAMTPIPAYTWPFILTTWVALLIARRPSAPAGTPADAAAQAA